MACTSTITTDCTCDECTGCPVQLDTACVFYHKDNSELSELDGLGMTNGATLELILEAIDDKVKELKIADFTLPTLRTTYTINTLQQLAQSIDTEIAILKADIETAGSSSATPLVAVDTATIDFTASGTLNHTLTASVKLSTLSGNRITASSDGLYAAPQTLSVNYATKELSIADGNTVSLAALSTGVGGYLGEVADDPTALNGQYWYNTTSTSLKIKLGGVVRTITIV